MISDDVITLWLENNLKRKEIAAKLCISIGDVNRIISTTYNKVVRLLSKLEINDVAMLTHLNVQTIELIDGARRVKSWTQCSPKKSEKTGVPWYKDKVCKLQKTISQLRQENQRLRELLYD